MHVCMRRKTPSTADLFIENYPQTADVPAMGDRPRLRSWFSPYKIYDVGGVWILDVAACSQHRDGSVLCVSRNVTAPPSMTARERRATCYHPIAGTSAVECRFSMEWSAVAGNYPCTHTQVINFVLVWRHKRVVVCDNTSPFTSYFKIPWEIWNYA